MKKMVVMMDVYDERSKQRVIRTFAKCSGVSSIAMDAKEGKLTVTGDLDELNVLWKLRRRWRNAKMATFGPYDAKKEAETAATKKLEEAETAAKKKLEELERERLEALYQFHRENLICPMYHHNTIVCDDGQFRGCVIS